MPQTPLTLLQLGQSAALAALADGTAHAALLRLDAMGELAPAELSRIPLYVEQPVVVAAKGHAVEAADNVTLADLAGFGILDDSDWAGAVELAAANAGVAIMPQSVARAYSRRDVTARPVIDAPTTSVALAWPAERATAAVEEFIGIVRGRTANSSRGAQPSPAEPVAPARTAAGSGSPGAKRSPRRPGPARPRRRR
jgi:DNA-binding transcriptional LysR family regulator